MSHSQPVGAGPGSEQQLLASFATYAEAQALVDRMSDDGFPVEQLRIIGDGVRTVEQVTGRMSLGKAAMAGAASGAWFGLLIGLLLGLFTTGPAWLWLLLTSLMLGVVWGAAFGALAHALTRSRS
ncbi:general stress protein [Nocardioides pakistanensis]